MPADHRSPIPMRRLLLAALTVGALTASAQQVPGPYPVAVGEHLRVRLAPTSGEPDGATCLIGRVQFVSADTLGLRCGASPAEPLAWSSIAAVDRRSQNRAGEAIGLAIGGVLGGLAGYVIGDAATEDPLGRVALVPGALGGLLVGGVVGAHLGPSWEPVAASRAALVVRVSVSVR